MTTKQTTPKLAFSTLGCPEWTLDKIISAAVEYGFDGIDFRGCGYELDIRHVPEFSPERIHDTADRIKGAGLSVSGLSSSARLLPGTDSSPELSMGEIRDYIKMASVLGAEVVRVFPGPLGTRTYGDALAEASARLREAASAASGSGVGICIETHDDWVETAKLAEIFDAAGDPEGTGVLWDVHHPYRLKGENINDSYGNIGSRTVYTHWKDSVLLQPGKPEYKLVPAGEGDVPLRAIHELLRGGGYCGWYTLEWEKRWHKDIAEPETAFPAFVREIKSFG